MEFYCRYKSSRKRTGTNARLDTSLVIATENLLGGLFETCVRSK